MDRMRFGIGVVLVCLLGVSVAPAAAQAVQKDGPPAKKVAVAAPINLNTATASQLTSLPGIGAKTAERIIEYREKSGGFKKIEELMNVRGVGEKSFLKIKDLITVTPPKLRDVKVPKER